MNERQMQIGEVAERTSLSLRTIRHYEEVDLVVPSARSKGGFRLYTETDVERLMVVRRMKPLGFSLEEMRDLLEITDRLSSAPEVSATSGTSHIAADDEARERLRERLDGYREAADARCEKLRVQLAAAEDFAATLRQHLESST